MAAPELLPIPIYDNYFFEEGTKKLFGFSEEGLIDIKIEAKEKKEVFVLVDFFKQDGNLYINIIKIENTGSEANPVYENISYYYEQAENNISNILELPEREKQVARALLSNNFKIFVDNHKSQLVTKVINLSNGCVFVKEVSGSYETKKGLFFNVTIPLNKIKPSGLYFFPRNRTSCHKTKENGFFY